jgi:general secretion pathway protein C
MAQWQTQIDQLRKDERTPIVLAGLLVLLLLWTLLSLISTFKMHHLAISPTKPTAAVSPLPSLANLHLFGVYASNLEALPVTQLQLTLEGTVVSVDAPTLSHALISSPSAPTKVYAVGDTLPGNATITRITKDYVVINDNGSLEKLALPIKTVTSDE